MKLSYANKNQVLVVGYPRSGNTFTARLLGEVLKAPVTGAYNARPLAEEGLGRSSNYVVRQLHLRPVLCPERPTGSTPILTACKFCTNLWTTERVVHVVRDPRDVAVSAFFYWKRNDLKETIDAMIDGGHPLGASGSWEEFVASWICEEQERNDHTITTIRYEDLVADTRATLSHILSNLKLPANASIKDAVERQSFNAIRNRVNVDGNSRPYGKAIQLHHLRKGKPGDWKNHFDESLNSYALANWSDMIEVLGYEPHTTNNCILDFYLRKTQ